MASASRDPARGEIWSAHASAILPILQAAAACSLVGLSEAMLSDKTSLESADPSKLPHRPCLIIEQTEQRPTFDVVVFTTCGRGSRDITQLSAHSQFFAVSVGATPPWPRSTSPVLNVLPAWPKSFSTPSYAIAYRMTISRSALIDPWSENAYPGAVFRCDEDDVEEIEDICAKRRSTYSLLGPDERASWDRTYEVSRQEWLAARPAESNLSTTASEVYAHRYAVSEQPRAAGRPTQDSNRRRQHAFPLPLPVISRSRRPAQQPVPPLEMSPSAPPRTNGRPHEPHSQVYMNRSQTRPSAHDRPEPQDRQRSRGPSKSLDESSRQARNDDEADTPDITPTDSPSSLADSLSMSDSEGPAGPELLKDDPEGCSSAGDPGPANHLLLSLDGDDAETVSGTISYSQIVKGLSVRPTDKLPSNLAVAVANPQEGKKTKRFSRVNIFAVGLRMGAGTRTTVF